MQILALLLPAALGATDVTGFDPVAQNLRAARAAYAEARAIYRETGNRPSEGHALLGWGEVELEAGRRGAAHRFFIDAAELFDLAGMSDWRASALEKAAQAERRTGRLMSAG